MSPERAEVRSPDSGDGNAGDLISLSNIRPLYFLPVDPLAAEVLIPSFRVADTVD